MRETQILRGLHKARANFADGFVSSPESQEQLARGSQSLRRIGAGAQTAKDLPFAAGDLLIGAVRQPLSAMYNGLRGGSQPASAPQVAAPNPNPASVAPTIIAPAIEAMQQRHEMMKGLAQGTAFLEGPGTGTSDSIPANLSRGEAVLPAKTVRAVGAHNIARLIQDTNDGKPPKGLRAGGKYARGGLPDLPSLDLSGAEGPQPMPDALRTKPSVVEPAEAPAKPYTPPKVNPRTGAYVQGSTGTVPGTAPSVAQPPAVETPTPKGLGAQIKAAPGKAFDALKGAADGVVEKAGSAVEGLKGKAAGALGGLAALGEGISAYDDMSVPGMTDMDKFKRGVEGVAQFGLAAAGGAAGGAAGTLIPVPGATVAGMLGGGYLGHNIPSYLAQQYRDVSGSDFQLPSEKAAGLRAKQNASQTVTADPQGPLTNPQNPADQTANMQLKKPFEQSTAGAGRGTVVPPNSPAAKLQPSSMDPASRDMTAELSAVPRELPSDLRKGVVHKTIDPKTGRVTYSGIDVTPGANGQTQFVDGMGKDIKTRGSVGGGIVGDANGVVSSYGAGLRSGQGADVSGALQAAAQRGDWDAVKGYYQNNGGTWMGKTAAQEAQANGPGALLLQQIQRGLNNGGSLTRAGLAALQSLDATQRQYAATMAGHDVQRRGQDLSYDSSMYGHQTQAGLGALQRQILLAEMQRGLQKDSLKETNENIERSPLVMGRDKDGNASPDKDKMARLKQFYGKVGFHSMDPAAQENANAQFGLSEAVRDHLSKAFGGVAPPPGAIKITGVRDAELADTAKGRGFVRGLLGPVSPGNYGKSVVLNVNGVEQAVPADLFDGDNLAYVNQALKQLGHEPLSPHHLTGGK